jgi:hypothetical protein
VLRSRIRRHCSLFGVGLVMATGFVATGGVAGGSTAGATSSSAPVCSTSTATPRTGVFAGTGSPSGISSFESTTGANVSLGSDYLPFTSGFAGMSNAQDLEWWTAPWVGAGCQLVLGVPMIPENSNGVPAGTLADGAAGKYNNYFRALASTLLSAGLGNSILRLGWEFSGSWYPWSVSNATEAENFAKYWRQIVIAMRGVSGTHFTFDWNPAGGFTTWPIDDAYPGNDYVEYVGLDRFDQTWLSPLTPELAWNNLTTMADGMGWLVKFGAAHDKPLTLSEFGVSLRSDGRGLGDDPYFINQMAAWIASNNVAFDLYYNSDSQAPDQYDAITDGNFPNALTAYEADFDPAPSGGSHSGTPGPLPTTTMVEVSPTAPQYGQGITATVAVVPYTATGTVQLAVDGVDVGGPMQLSAGTAYTSLPALAVGGHTVTAVYSGASTDQPSQGTLSFQDAAAQTTLSTVWTGLWGSAQTPSFTMTGTLESTATDTDLSGQSITFTADNGAGSCRAVTDSSGTADCSITLPNTSDEPNSYTGAYAGTTDYQSSSGTSPITD